MTREKRLGRGLEAMLGRLAALEAPTASPADPDILPLHSGDESDWTQQQYPAQHPSNRVDIMLLEGNPFQPRKEFDETELEKLADNLQAQGMLQAVAVREIDGRYQIIAGERRWRAALRAGWTEIPVDVKENISDRDMAELALTENMQRVDLNAIEKATAFHHYLESYGGTHEELAERLAVKRSTVSNLLRLLELPHEIQACVCRNELDFGHVRALLPLPEGQQIDIAKRIVREDWSVRQTEQFVKEIVALNQGSVEKESDAKKPSVQSVHLASLEQEFRSCLGTKVKLSESNGKGKITIPFSSNEEFERLFQLICRVNH